MYRFFGIFAGLVVFSNSVYAQDSLWTKTYGGTNEDWGYSVQECSSGGFIIAGATESYSSGGDDVYLIRTDADGNPIWTKTFGGTGYDWGRSVQECSSGGFIIAGYTDSYGAGLYDVYLIRTNSSGNAVWAKTYGGASYDYGYSVQECSSGGFIIVGSTSSSGNGNKDVYLIRTDSLGNVLWAKTYGGALDDYGYSVQECSNGGFIVAGYTGSYGNGSGDAWLIRTDINGDTIWTKTYGGSSEDVGSAVQECSDGGFIIAGNTYPSGSNDIDAWLIKTNANGDTIWAKTYGGTGSDYGFAVQECSNGGYIVTGETNSYGNGWYDVYLIRTDSLGDTIWTQTYGGGTGNDEGRSVQECSSGGFIITGSTGSFGAGGYDVYLIRVSESGGIEAEYPKSEIQNPKLQVYPNPVFGSAVIKYGVPVKSKVSLGIYDLTGRLVKTLVNGEKETGYYTVRWDAWSIKSGIYFAKFEANNYEETRKIVLMK